MAYTRSRLKQSDLTRYAKAMQAAGVTDYRVILRPDGTQEVAVGQQAKTPTDNDGWEDV